jgi:hypothetical protein
VEHLPLAEPSADDPEPVKDLERARLNSGRPGLSVRRRVALDETDGDAQPSQQAGEHESGRAGTHDEHVGIGHGEPWYTGGALCPSAASGSA